VGAKGTGEGGPRDLILDAGALIAFERGDYDVQALLKTALTLSSRIVMPATALAQVWRGGPRSAALARLIDAGEIDPLDEARAKEVGIRLGARRASDVADAHVVCCAVEHQAEVATSDPDDIRALADTGEPLSLIPV
jgi:predicted nucleic acid-binding protein